MIFEKSQSFNLHQTIIDTEQSSHIEIIQKLDRFYLLKCHSFDYSIETSVAVAEVAFVGNTFAVVEMFEYKNGVVAVCI